MGVKLEDFKIWIGSDVNPVQLSKNKEQNAQRNREDRRQFEHL
jgi:hypothetical protein